MSSVTQTRFAKLRPFKFWGRGDSTQLKAPYPFIEREIGVITEAMHWATGPYARCRSKSVSKNLRREITLRFRRNEVTDVGRVTAIC